MYAYITTLDLLEIFNILGISTQYRVFPHIKA